MDILIYLVTGLISGAIGGMGIGGGVVLIPALSLFLGVDQKQAQLLNLVYFLPTAAAALIGHIKNRSVEKRVILRVVCAGTVSAVLGATLGAALHSELLRKCFGGFLLVLGVAEFFKKTDKAK